MSDSSYQDETDSSACAPTNEFPEELEILFDQLDAQAVEQFYRSYQLWTTRRSIADLQFEIAMLQQEILQNAERMKRLLPTPMALAMLAQLQAAGVEDVDLLDCMLERGDIWLGYIMQLLERCEQMGIVHNRYTTWCERALSGAYDWLESLDEISPVSSPPVVKEVNDSFIAQSTTLFLQELINDDEKTESLPSIVLPKTELDPVVQEPLLTITIEEFSTALVAPSLSPEQLTAIADEVKLDPVEASSQAEEAVPFVLPDDILLADEALSVEEAHQAEEAPSILKEELMSDEDDITLDTLAIERALTARAQRGMRQLYNEELISGEKQTPLDTSDVEGALVAATHTGVPRVDVAIDETDATVATNETDTTGEQPDQEEPQRALVEKKAASQSNFIKRSWAKIFRD